MTDVVKKVFIDEKPKELKGTKLMKFNVVEKLCEKHKISGRTLAKVSVRYNSVGDKILIAQNPIK